MNRKTILIVSLLPAAVALAIALPASAVTLTNPLGTEDLRVAIGQVIKGILGLTGVLALLMFTWGGIQMMTAAGSPEKVKKGKDTLTWAVIGLVVIFTAYTLVNTLLKVLTGAGA